MTMSDLERAVLRFNASWVEVYPDAPAPETTNDIVAWYKSNHERFSTVRYIPGTGWVDLRNERLSDETGMQQHRMNVVIDEASLIEILTREPDEVEGYW